MLLGEMRVRILRYTSNRKLSKVGSIFGKSRNTHPSKLWMKGASMLNSRLMRTLFAIALAFAMVSLPACAPANNATDGSSAQQTQNAANDEAQAQDEISVQVIIDSSAVDNIVTADSMETLAADATAYDALLATGLDVVSSDSAYGEYVSSIDGLAEKQHGDMSGWGFMVNGEYPTESASSCVLNDGDTVTWTYMV